MSKSKLQVPERKVGLPCGEKCRLKCKDKINEISRQQLFDAFWGLGNLERQREFIVRHSQKIKPKYRYSSTQDFRALNTAFYFEVAGSKIRVCKPFFKSTLGLSYKAIQTALSKVSESGVIQGDLRGKHGHQPTIDPQIKQSVIDFINSIPKIESHYLRAQTKRQHISSSQIRVASLRYAASFRHLCGAVIISPEVAITAAHCVQEPHQYELKLNNLCNAASNSKPDASVMEIIKHPCYNKYTRAHDIALLRLRFDESEITWPDNAILPNTSFGLSGECIAYGYGYMESKAEIFSDQLKAARMKIISLDKCIDILGLHVAPRYDSGMLCALGDGVDTCQGDSGGPIMCEDKLQGITSYGMSCGIPNVPSVYTSIGIHLPWIHNTIIYISNT
ncbi:unnamed protein product [Parnassius apollo]|uniref:(apollo) hypothetical protein n=1 Tax=Parnassius apollo TaxID=110799 RepID=A0A8S3Y1X7_PARAO|nr:unnamed protein product [Parnassius apollo]